MEKNMKDNFGHREKLKRAEHACTLLKNGKTLHETAILLGIAEETVKRYLEEAQHKESKKNKEPLLTGFASKTTTLDTLFASSLKEGFTCARCKRYAKREAGILWESNVFLCRVCYMGLTNEDMARFRGA